MDTIELSTKGDELSIEGEVGTEGEVGIGLGA